MLPSTSRTARPYGILLAQLLERTCRAGVRLMSILGRYKDFLTARS